MVRLNVNGEGITGRKFCQMMKGIAIILMITHHAFGFPDWYVPGVKYPELTYCVHFFSTSPKICVAIYAFLTGIAFSLHRDKSLRYTCKKIVTFLASYWVVCIILLFIAVTICDYRISPSKIMKDFFGISTHNSLMCFCWYVSFYILAMIILPFFVRILALSKRLLVCLLSLIVLLVIVVHFNFSLSDIYNFSALSNTESHLLFLAGSVCRNFVCYFPVILAGFFFARFNILNKMANRLKSVPAVFGVCVGTVFIFLSFAILYVCSAIAGISTGVVSAPLFILGIYLLGIWRIPYLNNILLILGKYSMNIWFLHCLFFSPVTSDWFQPIAYWMHVPVLVVCWILLMCTIVSIPISKVQKAVSVRIARLW